jgi:chromosome segregation ATPase
MTSYPPAEFAAWIACLAFVLMLVNQGSKVVSIFRGKPEASEVERDAAQRFATKIECVDKHKKIEEENARLWAKIGGMERGAREHMDRLSEQWRGRLEAQAEALRKERQEDLGELHGKVNKVDREIGEISAQVKGISAQLERLDDKLDSKT